QRHPARDGNPARGAQPAEGRGVTLARAVPFAQSRLNVTPIQARPHGSAILNEALGIHSVDGLLIDICFNTGNMWRGLAYKPLRCDINASLPNLDVVANWSDLPKFVGVGRALTIVADPLFLSHLGGNSAYRRYASAANPFSDVDI